MECPQGAIIAKNFPPRKAKPAEAVATPVAPKAPVESAPKAEVVNPAPASATESAQAPKAEA